MTYLSRQIVEAVRELSAVLTDIKNTYHNSTARVWGGGGTCANCIYIHFEATHKKEPPLPYAGAVTTIGGVCAMVL